MSRTSRHGVVMAPAHPKPQPIPQARDKCICPRGMSRFLPVPGMPWVSRCKCGAIKRREY